jgi:diguanylate cyclase (GGDEF)-like protein/PAS domain S-box-containing protein
LSKAREPEDIPEADSVRTRLQAIYDVLPVGITITDYEGNIIDVNPASAGILGLSPTEHLSRDFAKDWLIYDETGQLMAPERFASVRALKENVEVRDQLMQVSRPDGTRVWLSVSAMPVLRDGVGVVVAYVDVTELIEATRKIRKLSDRDQLTGLPNRSIGLERLRQMISTASFRSEQVVVLQIDLDNLREINEAYDHSTGDRLIREAARQLVAELNEDAVVARLVGDEFLAAVPTTNPGEVAERLLDALRLPIQPDGKAAKMTASAGGSIFPDDSKDADELLRQADIAALHAKKNRGTHAFFEPRMDSQLGQRVHLAAELERALETEALELYFQPQFSLSNRRLCGAEALLRWRHPERGWVPPEHFIPVAENRGMMPTVGEWVFKAACRQLAAWKRKGNALPGRLAINISAQQVDRPDFADRLAEQLQSLQTSAEEIEIELTENSVIADPIRAVDVLNRLKQMGLHVALDDFGKGYSSLIYLRQFNLNKLKIDGSFITKMVENESDRAIASTIIAMAQNLGLTTLAEHVETREQAELLAGMGCDSAQGFFYGRPIDGESFYSHWLADRR